MPQFMGWTGHRLEPFKRRVVYTCMFGYSEKFADRPVDVDPSTDLICFTDDPALKSERWRFSYLDSTQFGPVRTSKMVKHLAHRHLGEYEESIYIDNTVRLKVPAAVPFDLLAASDAPLLCFKHPQRDCLYDEADVLINDKIDDPRTIRRQMLAYKIAGYPRRAGLVQMSILIRRHRDPALIPVMEAWFDHVMRYSYRDQLSFNFVARRAGFVPTVFAQSILDNPILEWPVFEGPRIPRGFRDDIYLELNPDVKESGMNPREHYLKLGAGEGRRWR